MNRRLIVLVFSTLIALTFGVIATTADASAADTVVGSQLPTISLPNAGGKGAGFRCDIVIGEVQGAGYVPFEIALRSFNTFSADRNFILRVVTEKTGQAPPRNGFSIDLPITAQQGNKVALFKRYLPKWAAGYSAKISIIEDGRALPDYEAIVGKPLPPNGYRFKQLDLGEQQLNWIFISDQATVDPATMPDIRPVVTNSNNFLLWEANGFPSQEANPQFWKEMIDQNWFSAIGQSELPTDWRAYNQHDAVVIGPQSLEKLRKNADAFAALRDWLLVGGTIVIYEATTPTETMKLIDTAWTADEETKKQVARYVESGIAENKQLLNENRLSILAIDAYIKTLKSKPTASSPESGQIVNDPTSMGMGMGMGMGMIPNSMFSFRGQDYYFPTDIKDAQLDRTAMKKLVDQHIDIKSPRISGTNPDLFAQPVGAGMVIGITASPDDRLNSIAWSAVRSLFVFRISPMLRRGVDPMLGDRRFDRWLIPGVAQPPVYTFMGLLVGFVILVGPIAYRKTSKAGRSYLMFGIAPALAMLTTIAMFTYGIVSDGFGTMTRIRQLTFIDGTSGDAGERYRATYFAGVRPSGGIKFPAEAEVMQYPEGGDESWQEHYFKQPAIMGNITIDDQSQRFDSSFLPSRTQRQFVVHLPRRGIGRVNLVPATDTELAKVESTLAFPLLSIVLRDHDGDYWTTDDLAANGSSTVTEVKTTTLPKMIGKMYNDFRPVSAIGRANSSGRSNRNYSNQAYDLINETAEGISGINLFSEGTFEQILQQQLQSNGELPNGYFIATATPSSDVMAVETAEVIDSVRYLYGTLPKPETSSASKALDSAP
ncbi:hypothetical protein [Rubripirellula reticaptiva]|uniref:Uncharacterized protein n=1 Tax=Rubripirellula reticaptiva TaxID=2528013 RepID=A0A5C6EH77_9BACT|nr:hypothetical protein [Rubripirellula reticaptiva]TWU47834.1 hypothetical protein Poly59_46760 [Rubripirellula reticaptiva]